MKRFILPIFVITAFAVSIRSEAASGTWNTISSGNWSDSGKWASGTVADGSGSTATFSAPTPNTTSPVVTVTLDGDRIIGNLTFSGTAAAGTHNFTLSGSSILTLSGTTPTITGALDARTATVSVTLAGTQGVTFSNTSSAGDLIISGNNTYTGVTTIAGASSNVVTIANNNALGGTADGTTVNSSSGLLLADGVTVTGETLTLKGSGGTNSNGALRVATGGTAEWAGNIILAANSRVVAGGSNGASGNLKISGVISGSNNLDLSGLGTLTLSGANTYTGTTTLYRGILKLDVGDNRLPTGTALTMGGTANNSVFDLNGRNQQIASIADGSNTSSRTITNTSGTASTLTLSSSTDASFAATGSTTITGNLSLIKSGSFTQTLAKVNSYTGNTTINAGTLLLSDNSTMTFFIKGNGVNNGISGSGGITLDGDLIFDLSGASLVANNSWNIINVNSLTETFGTNFTVQGFTETSLNSGVWTKTGNSDVRFYEATGILSVVPEPSVATLLILGGASALCLARRRRF